MTEKPWYVHILGPDDVEGPFDTMEHALRHAAQINSWLATRDTPITEATPMLWAVPTQSEWGTTNYKPVEPSVQPPTREQVVQLLTLLAHGRAEYLHGKEPQHQGDLRAMRFDELIVYAEREAARQIRDIVAGDNDGRGWMPSWRWDDLDAVLTLFQQPTPSEVEVEGSFFAVADLPDILARHMRALDDAHRREKQHWIDQHEQTTPSVEPTCSCGHVMDDHDLSETGECQVAIPWCPCMAAKDAAEPVSIADMAPRTTEVQHG